MRPRFAIIGAGNGGLTAAADLASRGYEVTGLHDKFEQAIAPVRRAGVVRAVGPHLEGAFPIPLATTVMAEATADADVIVITTTANAHEEVAATLAPHVRDGQVVLLCPGYLGGALIVRRVFRERGVQARIYLAETSILPYATRIVAPGVVGLRAPKRWVALAALPAADTMSVLERLGGAFPMFEPAPNVLYTGLSNINPVAHVPTTLLNLGRIEDGSLEATDFHEWMTPSVRRLMDAVDRERIAVARAFGVEVLPREAFLARSYEGIRRVVVPSQGSVSATHSMVPPRYLDEDVPMGLVPIVEFARRARIAVPIIEGLICLASVVKGTDYWSTGRTLARMGIKDMSDAELQEVLSGGGAESAA
jgi:opine dehydrogenase